MVARPLPRFDLARCNASGWCIATCPTQCLDLWNDQPGVAEPAKCASCALCVFICPTQAVALDPPPNASAGPAEPTGSPTE